MFNHPSLNIMRPLKESMATAARECGLSREDIVDKMNDLAERYGVLLVKGNGRRLKVATLEKWLNPGDKQHVISLKALPVFCAVVKSSKPMRALIEPLGYQVVDDKDTQLLTWAKHYHSVKRTRAEMRKIEAEL